jgi:hypothetical protein
MSAEDFVTPLHDAGTDDDPYAEVRAAAERWKAVEQQRRNATIPEADDRAPLVRDEDEAEIRKRERLEQAQAQVQAPAISPGHPSLAEQITGAAQKVGNAIKKVFVAPRPKAYAMQFDRQAILIHISDDMLTDEEIRELQERAKHDQIRVVAIPPNDILFVKEARSLNARLGLPPLTKDSMWQLRTWARQVRNRALLRGEPIQEPLTLADLRDCWQPPRPPTQPTQPPRTRPPQKQHGSNIEGIRELAHGRWGDR